MPCFVHALSETDVFLIGPDVRNTPIGRDVGVKLTGLIRQPFVGVLPHDGGTDFTTSFNVGFGVC
jgi:hypothetical protein